MATFKKCISCDKLLALHLFIGKKGITCRKCLSPEKYIEWLEKTRKKNNRWRENNPEKIKELASKYYHNNREKFAKKGLNVQLILKKESYDFNVFLKEKGIIGLDSIDDSQEFIEINNQLIDKKNERIKELNKNYRERKGDELKEYKANWYQENKLKNEN